MKLIEQMFDFEVFPEWWCCVLGRYPQDHEIPESIKDDFIVITSDTPAAREELLKVMCDKRYVNMGYNIKRYDNIILNGIASGFSPEQLKILNDIIINPDCKYDSIEHMRISEFAYKRYKNFVYQDLMDDNTGSLKEKESVLELDIRESTVPFGKTDLTEQEKEDIIFYCKHDVWATMCFYKRILYPFIMAKLAVGRVFKIPMDVCYRSTNAQLAALATKARRVRPGDAERRDIEVPAGLRTYLTYSLPNKIVERLCSSPDKFDVELFGNDVSYSNGGIHSVLSRPKEIANKKKYPNWFLHVKDTEEWSLLNIDASSFYSHIMIAWGGLSRAIPQPEEYARIVKARLALKSVIQPFEDTYGKDVSKAPVDVYEKYKNDKEQSQAYKLILNTTFGASGNKYLTLYDPYMTSYTCRIGQLLITALANNIYNQIGNKNIYIIQTNTDGILVYINNEYLDLLDSICKVWEETCKIPLEAERGDEIYQRDVNNYIIRKKNGRLKSKGAFFVTDVQQPGHNRVRPLDAYVCKEAAIDNLFYNKDIVERIYNERDLSKFVVTCHKGSFRGIVRSFNDGRPDEELHRVNRTYASLDKNLGMIYKIKKIQGELRKYKAPGCPPHCELLNSALSKYDMNELHKKLDHMWYIEKCYEMLNVPIIRLLNGETSLSFPQILNEN